MSDPAQFDAFAKNYDKALSEALSLTGEAPVFYAERRIAMPHKLISGHNFKADRILDFGCGPVAVLAEADRPDSDRGTAFGLDTT